MIAEALREIPIVAAIERWDSSAVSGGTLEHREVALEIRPGSIVAVCEFLKREHGFERLGGLTCVDWYPSEPRFQVVYLLHSISRNERLRLLVRLEGDAPVVESVTGVWRSANFYEREVFDLFGVRFRNHPDLTRIMMPEDWEGHPLRKDYDLQGGRYGYRNQ
ncbi:MAG: NADH-quinone oxidoreductase subunit C [Bryobacterales bacterium]|nr:NADH-quinone oxidoreductase subunit C [Bryobacterales bacterium]